MSLLPKLNFFRALLCKNTLKIIPKIIFKYKKVKKIVKKQKNFKRNEFTTGANLKLRLEISELCKTILRGVFRYDFY